MFSVRIITADHYMSPPIPDLDVIYSDFRGSEVKQVPVVRIFGSTPTGRKACLHVHGVFPYIYVPYDGCEPQEREAYKLSLSLDKAINVLLGKSNATTQHVYKISLVSGRPFYGFHSKEHQFFKIFLYNPIMVKKAADLLQSGAVLNKSFQPHEAHLTFILQFFIDFNLYGMNYINLSKVNYRHPISTSVDALTNLSTDNAVLQSFERVPEELYLSESVPRMSTCELELDALATAITNRSTVSEKMTVIPGLAAIWEEERERRRMHGLSSQLSPAPSQPRNNSVFTKSELHYLERIHNQLLVNEVDSSPLPANVTDELILNTSGYPSETPENASLQNASLVEVHLPTPLRCIQNKTSDDINVQSSPKKDESSSQNSVLLDSQDEILMNAWEGMLEEKYEDSILGTQPPLDDNGRLDDVAEELVQEEVEDNHLLEMSQVFDWEEKIENKSQNKLGEPVVSIEGQNFTRKSLTTNSAKSSNTVTEDNVERNYLLDEDALEIAEETLNAAVLLDGNAVESTNLQEEFDENVIESQNADYEFQKHNEKELNAEFPEEKEMKPGEEEEFCGISEWEDGFWDDEDEDSYEPIAQLDGVDDLIEPSTKLIEGAKDMPKQRRRLGVGRPLSGIPKKDYGEKTSDISPIPGTSTGNATARNIAYTKDQSSNSSHKYDNVSKKKLAVEMKELRPHVPILMAKHRRVHELQRMGRLSLSRTKEKIPSNLTLHKSENSPVSSRTDICKKKNIKGVLKLNDSQVSHSYNIRWRLNESIKAGKELSSCVPSPANVIPSIKPCTVRLELIDTYCLPYLCSKHGVVLSNSSLNQLRGICTKKKKKSPKLGQKKMAANQPSQENFNQYSNKEIGQHSCEEINQSLRDKPILGVGYSKSDDQNDVSDSTRSNTNMNDTFCCSVSQEPLTSEKRTSNRNWSGSIMKDNFFSELDCKSPKISLTPVSMSSNKFNVKKIENKESSPKNPKKQKEKVASDKNYYRPLKIVLQKSPVRSKNKEKLEELTKTPPIPSVSLQECTDVVKQGVEKHGALEENEAAHCNKSKGNEKYLIEEVDETEELRYKPLKMVNANSSLCKEFSVVGKEAINLQDVQSSGYSATPGDQDGSNKIKVRKRLEFSDDSSCSIKKSEVKSPNFFDTSSESDHEYEASGTRKRPVFSDDPSCSNQKSEVKIPNVFNSSSESDHDYEAPSTKTYSESSCDEDGLGIMSFCEEDVFNSSILTPSFAEKPIRRSIMPNQSPLVSEKNDFNKMGKGEEMLKSKNHNLKNTESVSPTSDTSFPASYFSDDKDTEDNEDSIDVCDYDYGEAFGDNGIEYAPLLKAPSWQVVAKHQYSQERTGLPYCSDPDDIPSKPMEVGELVLRLYSNRPSSLPPFENCLGLPGLEGHRKRVLENTFGGTEELEIGNQWEKISKAALLPDGGSREVIITPYEHPPKYEDVSQWMIDERYEEPQKKANEETPCNKGERKFKLLVGCPLEAGDDDEDLEVVSLSPCSTSSSQEVTNRKRSFAMQSTPHSSSKHSRHHNETAIPNDNCLTFSPIQGETDEEEIILCTPPPLQDTGNSLNEKESKMKSGKLSLSKKRLLSNSSRRKNLLMTIKEEYLNALPKNAKKVELHESESSVTKEPKISVEDRLKLQKAFLQKQQHHVGLGGSGHSSCQIEGISPNNTFGFQNSPSNLQNAKAIQQPEHVRVMTMEVHVRTRGDLRPDPECDPIQSIFYSVVEDGGIQMDGDAKKETGILLVDITSKGISQLLKKTGVTIKAVQTACDEPSLFKTLGELMKKWDPDILAGYEVEMQSWGYVLERGRHLGLDVKSLLSRVPVHSSSEGNYREKSNVPSETDSKRIKDYEDYDPVQVTGRIVLNVWRLMRSEVALTSYTFENVMYHLLHERVPLHSFKSLNNWWEHRTHLYRWITVEHWIIRVEGVMRLLFQLDLIGRTSELARLFGIQFYEVFSRGSQFRVESIMLRFAKPHNYVCVSPNHMQRASMRAPEHLPLIMEPESRFFADPVIVLDFQSLYPSIIIAYNYCYSTCLGRVKHLDQPGPFQFGCTNLMVPPDQIAKLLRKQKKLSCENKGNSRSIISFSPCGVAFVGKKVREGILPRMLSEILETRLMVKKALKENKKNRVVERVLNSRQLGLKLIANVTYGYTSANFSGRMPCIEVGDSVVSKGRETLERAISLVHEKWGNQGVRVVYGDTDSLFVLAKGFSRTEAFKLGAEIAEMVTENNPSPVKLKLEKIFQPCLLQTKKRYVGYAYETPDQEKPTFDAKGIETVRRDGCPAVAKVLEKSLRLLFDTRDVSLVKLHVQRQLGKLLSGRLSLQELTFAREYRGAAGYRPGACVPALQLARRWVSIDRRAEPRSGERVPYVIVSGPPGLPLFQLVRSPYELLSLNKEAGTSTGTQPQMRINAHYYITRVLVPPLQRCFSLIGVDVESWYADMPRKFRSIIQHPSLFGPALGNTGMGKPGNVKECHAGTSVGPKRSTISEYFATSDCLSCGSQLDPGSQAALCVPCMKNLQKTAFVLAGRSNSWERAFSYLSKVCQSCCQRMEPIECTSLDCPVLYRRHQAMLEMEQATTLQIILSKLSW